MTPKSAVLNTTREIYQEDELQHFAMKEIVTGDQEVLCYATTLCQ